MIDGFIELLDTKPSNGTHLIRVSAIEWIRPEWDDAENWIATKVGLTSGRTIRVDHLPDDIEVLIGGSAQ